jgi:Flp pilus assembly CpaE family ATPase
MFLKAALITESPEVMESVRGVSERTRRCGIVRWIDRHLPEGELRAAIYACAPEVVFVDVDSLSAGVVTVKALQSGFSDLQVVAVISTCNRHLILELMTAGVREVISNQPDEDEFLELMSRLDERLTEKPVAWGETCEIISFIPAKASAGATTLAINVASRLSLNPGARTLLMDLDLNSGLISFLLQVAAAKGLNEAITTIPNLDEKLWREFVVPKGPLDVLVPMELGPATRIDPLELHQLVSFIRRLYDFVCLDHSGNLERLSLETMKLSRHIFLVCTPEIPSLHLARQRIQFLNEMELGKRVSLLVNRSQKGAMISKATIEKMLDTPIFMEVSNDYRAVQKSALSGSHCDGNTQLGRQMDTLTDWIVKRESAQLAPKRKRFVDYFTPTARHH